jgi:hypothetical protein
MRNQVYWRIESLKNQKPGQKPECRDSNWALEKLVPVGFEE